MLVVQLGKNSTILKSNPIRAKSGQLCTVTTQLKDTICDFLIWRLYSLNRQLGQVQTTNKKLKSSFSRYFGLFLTCELMITVGDVKEK